jgi:flagellar export protein FliJ
MAVHHRLQVVLRIYRSQRDLRQQSVVAARDYHAKIVAEQNRLVEERQSLICDLRNLNGAYGLDVGKILNLQRHAEQLGQELQKSESAVAETAERVSASLAELLIADQSVRAIERLIERQAAADELTQEISAIREFDDVVASQFWQASYR